MERIVKVSVIKKDDIKALVKVSFEKAVEIFSTEVKTQTYVYQSFLKQEIAIMLARTTDDDRIVTKTKTFPSASTMESMQQSYSMFYQLLDQQKWFILATQPKVNKPRSASLYIRQLNTWILVCRIEFGINISYDLINQFISTLHRLNPNANYYELKTAFLELLTES